jgi:hypothetical protein
MLNDNEDTLKAHLKTLHRSLEETGEVDDELEMLLRQLDGDIKHVLERAPTIRTPTPMAWPRAARKSPPVSRPATRPWSRPCASLATSCRIWVSECAKKQRFVRNG